MFEARRRTTERGTYAVVRFHSFSSALSITAALDNLKSVLEQLGDTEGLLIDVRGNPGGTAELGEVIVRFFSAQPLTLGGVRFLNSAAALSAPAEKVFFTGLPSCGKLTLK